MKKILFVFFLLFSSVSLADQLAYLTKKQAENAAKKLKTFHSFWVFCGCCDDQTVLQIQPKAIRVEYTGFEEFYQVVVDYTGTDGKQTSIELDFAYVWVKKGKKHKTLGSLLHLEHDPCKSISAFIK